MPWLKMMSFLSIYQINPEKQTNWHSPLLKIKLLVWALAFMLLIGANVQIAGRWMVLLEENMPMPLSMFEIQLFLD